MNLLPLIKTLESAVVLILLAQQQVTQEGEHIHMCASVGTNTPREAGVAEARR